MKVFNVPSALAAVFLFASIRHQERESGREPVCFLTAAGVG